MDKIVHSQDFRSSDGLYNLVKERYPDVVMKGRDLFDAALFRDPGSAAVFYTFMAELKTQIDSAHPAPDHIASFREGVPPDCPECIARSDARTARAARALKCGTLRPAIVLYDEPHPLGDHIGAVQTNDLGKKPDLLIVMGTSLKVHGLRLLVKSFAKAVHSSRPSPSTNSTTSYPYLYNVLFVNRTPPPPGEWTSIIDYHIQGDTDTWVTHVLGEWKRSRPGDWEDGKGKAKGEKAKDGKAAKDKSVKGKDANATNAKTGKSKSKPPNSGPRINPLHPKFPSPAHDSRLRCLKERACMRNWEIPFARSWRRQEQGQATNRARDPWQGVRDTRKRDACLATLRRHPRIQRIPLLPCDRLRNDLFLFARLLSMDLALRHLPASSESTQCSRGLRTQENRYFKPIAGKTWSFRAGPNVGTPTPGRVYGARIVKSPVQPTVGRSPGFVSGLLRGMSMPTRNEMEGVEGPGVSASTSTSASASESGIETTESEMGALASASESDAG
ncbi:NAD-dependent histone deacetylase SIR2 [Rhizoctonia solani]|uniref:NAD-dependent histone deacetylase SIR2 n=1 Tax=Rhizoctonia solani TaxID=456999 RepID=A0A8H8NYH9_9AGAM|nr:NAD-dependent histone deacetylase SIR2 [Rhizoctonia solani]QRW21000.1 NAD-dependent histone deacetylase SIR2 [Rhizoctonia solani]